MKFIKLHIRPFDRSISPSVYPYIRPSVCLISTFSLICLLKYFLLDFFPSQSTVIYCIINEFITICVLFFVDLRNPRLQVRHNLLIQYSKIIYSVLFFSQFILKCYKSGLSVSVNCLTLKINDVNVVNNVKLVKTS